MATNSVLSVEQIPPVWRVLWDGVQLHFAMHAATTKAGLSFSACCPFLKEVPCTTVATDMSHETKCETMGDSIHSKAGARHAVL